MPQPNYYDEPDPDPENATVEDLEEDAAPESGPVTMPTILTDSELSKMLRDAYAGFREKMGELVSPRVSTPLPPATPRVPRGARAKTHVNEKTERKRMARLEKLARESGWEKPDWSDEDSVVMDVTVTPVLGPDAGSSFTVKAYDDDGKLIGVPY